MAALPKLIPRPTMTVAEFIEWEGDGTTTRYQLVDGEIRAMAPATIRHGRLQATIAHLIASHLGDGPCQVVVEPGVVPRIRSDANLRIPDLAVTCEPDEDGQKTLLDPLLVIEILSPSNEAETRANIWAYTTIPAVREIVLIHSARVAVELLARQEDGSWPADAQVLGAEDVMSLNSIDFRVPIPALYRGTRLLGRR